MNEWRPHPKQETALLSEAYETLYGGARGGGKTDAGMAWMLYPIEHSLYRGLVIRKNFADMNDWLDRAEVMYSGTGARFVNKDEIRFPGGAKILIGHYSDPKAYMKYQGHEYQRQLIEELTQIPTEEMYLKLLASCRSTVPEIKPQVFATCNPGGPGHTWVKKRFIDPSKPTIPFKDEISGRTRVFIPATVEDNPTLLKNDPDYVKFLESLPPDLRAQWRHGSWDEQKVKGAYFADDISQAQKENRICELALLPYDPVYVSWDLGINDEQVAWFYQIKGDQIRIIDVHADTNKSYSFYVQMLRERKYDYAKMILPHDGVKRAPDSLRSFQDELTEAGYVVEIVPRTKDKNRDIQIARTIFPRVWFDAEKCQEGIEALTQYRRRWLEEKGAFEQKPYHDWSSHYADAFMAMAISIPKPKADNYEKQADDYIEEEHELPVMNLPSYETETYDDAADEFIGKEAKEV